MKKLALPSYTVQVTAVIIVLVCGSKCGSKEMVNRQGHLQSLSSLLSLSYGPLPKKLKDY